MTNGKATPRCLFPFCPRQLQGFPGICLFKNQKRVLIHQPIFSLMFRYFLSGFRPAEKNALNHFQSSRHHHDIAMVYLPKLYSTSAFPMPVAFAHADVMSRRGPCRAPIDQLCLPSCRGSKLLMCKHKRDQNSIRSWPLEANARNGMNPLRATSLSPCKFVRDTDPVF